jgi:Ca2+/H+ antiporter
MDHSIIGLLLGLDPAAIALAGGWGFGVMLNRRHAILALGLLLFAVVASAALPVLWSWRSQQPLALIVVFAGGWGAAMGICFYGVLLWFRNERAHLGDDSPSS